LKGRRSSPAGKDDERDNQKMIVYRGLDGMPPRLRTTLRFCKNFTLNNAGIVFGNVYFIPTFAFDLDPTLGSSAVPFFTELGGMYTKYRVNGFNSQVSFSNLDELSYTVYLALCNVNPGNNTTHYPGFLSNPRTKSGSIGWAGGNGLRDLSISASQKDYAGYTNSMKVLDSTVGSTSGTAPLNDIYLLVGYQGPSAAVLGLWVNMKIDIDIEFFELYSPDA
jgi:hypothetical protein